MNDTGSLGENVEPWMIVTVVVVALTFVSAVAFALLGLIIFVSLLRHDDDVNDVGLEILDYVPTFAPTAVVDASGNVAS